MEGPPLGPGGEDITWPDQVAPRGRKASSTRKIKPQTSNLVGGGPSPLLAEVRRFVGRGPSLLAEGPGLGVPSPLLAEGPGCGPPPLLAGGPLVLVMGGPSPLLAEGPGCRIPPFLAGVRWPRWWPFLRGLVGGFACCVCLWRGVCWCVRCVFLVVVWVWVCLPCVLVAVWRLAVGFLGWGLLLV